MFPKPMRLPSVLVGITVRQGKRISQSGCEIRLSSTTGAVSRFAIVVPVSTHKRAVKRNFLKRHVRESVRHIAHQIAKPGDFVIFGRKELLGKTQQETEMLLTGLLKKFGCIV